MAQESLEKKLIEGCRNGKRSAQRKLYNTYVDVMVRLCLRYTKNMADAEEVCQEGFIKIFSKIEQFRFGGSFEGWMKRIMINTAIKFLKEKAKEAFYLNFDDYSETIPDIEEEIYNVAWSRDEMMDAIQNLSSGYRLVFNLYVFENYTHKQISEMLEISENTSKSQLARARARLKKELKEKLSHKEKLYL